MNYKGMGFGRCFMTVITAWLSLLTNPAELVNCITNIKSVGKITRTIPNGYVDMSQATPSLIKVYSLAVSSQLIISTISTLIDFMDYVSWSIGRGITRCIIPWAISTALIIAFSAVFVYLASKFHDRWNNTVWTVLGVLAAISCVFGIFTTLGSIGSNLLFGGLFNGIVSAILGIIGSIISFVCYLGEAGAIYMGVATAGQFQQNGGWNQPPQQNWNQPPQGGGGWGPQSGQPQQSWGPQQGQPDWGQQPQQDWGQPQQDWNQLQQDWNQQPQQDWNQPPQQDWNQPPQQDWNQQPQQPPQPQQPRQPQRPPQPRQPQHPPMQGQPQRPPMQGQPQRPPMQGQPQRPPMQGQPQRPPMQGQPQYPPMNGQPNQNRGQNPQGPAWEQGDWSQSGFDGLGGEPNNNGY